MTLRIGIALGMLAGFLAAGGLAQVPGDLEPPPPTAVGPGEDSGSWFSRLVDRHLRSRRQTGEALAGRALEAETRYAEFAGRRIEVVLVSQVANFDADWRSRKDLSLRVLAGLSGSLQSYTRDGTIRRFLLFHRGEPLDPFTLADSERLLRAQPYISDVRITVVPLEGETETVAVIVETRDRWPIGIDGKIDDRDRFSASLYSVNVLGLGLGWNNELIYHGLREPNWGYRGTLRQPNLGGSFTDLELGFEDSWRVLRRSARLERPLVHPGIKMVGGGFLARTDDRDNGGLPRKESEADLWSGKVISLGGRSATGDPAALLVPAVAVSWRSFAARPPVSLLENRGYHDRLLLLGGVTFQRLKDYQTSYLYRMGETEDVSSGLVLKATAGYEDGEFQKRSCGWTEAGITSIRNRGDLVFLRLGFGGFLRNGNFEQGVLDLASGYAAPLAHWGGFGQRWFLQARFTQGLDRYPEDLLSLGDRSGLRGIRDDILTGRQRLVANLESRLFTPWTALGFQCMLLGYADGGLIADQGDPLLRGRFSASTGLGIRLSNPDLVFPPLQVRIGLQSRLDGNGMIVGLQVGNSSPLGPVAMPGARPEPPSFDRTWREQP